MNSRQVRRLHRELDGAERFRLGLFAAARGDVKAIEAVVAQSPRTPLLQHGPVFDAANRAALGFGWKLGIGAAARIGFLNALRLITERLEHDDLAAAPQADGTLGVLERAREEVAVALVSLLQAFGEACEQVPGLDSEMFVSAMPPPATVCRSGR